MRFVKANGLVIHFFDEGRARRARRSSSSIRSEPTSASGTMSRSSSRPISASSAMTSAATGSPKSGPDRYDMADYARDLAALLDRCRRRSGDDRRPFDRRRHRAGALSPAARNSSPRSCFATPRRKSEPTKSWDPRIAQIERGGIEAIADAVLERWFTADFRVAPRRRTRGLARHADADAEAGLSCRLRGLETRRPSPLCRRDPSADPLPGRRRGRLDARRSGAGDGCAHQRLAL